MHRSLKTWFGRKPAAALTLAIATLAGSGLTMHRPAMAFDEWEEDTFYYEDDAWYDVSEWFDGNDFNPTDESIGVWDNETYDIESETGDDFDNDYGYGYLYHYGGDGYGFNYDYEYGYDGNWSYDDYEYDNPYPLDDESYGYDYWTELEDQRGYDYDDSYGDTDEWYGYDGAYEEDDWFYDYYDEGYGYYSGGGEDGRYDYSYRYYDFNNDGLYDGFASYSDWDDDGEFEDYDYYAINETGGSEKNQAKAREQASVSGQQRSVSGRVFDTKTVSVRDTKNMVVRMENNNDEKVIVDLGPVRALDQFDLSEGDQISAVGAMTQVGNKRLLVAMQVSANGQSTQIDRSRRKFTGQIDDLRSVQMRGRQHRMLVMETTGGKRRLVDIGPADQVEIELNQGDEITVMGPLAKIGERKLVMAQTIRRDGEQVRIDRRSSDNQDGIEDRQARR